MRIIRFRTGFTYLIVAGLVQFIWKLEEFRKAMEAHKTLQFQIEYRGYQAQHFFSYPPFPLRRGIFQYINCT